MIIIVKGISGSGKSTVARRVAAFYESVLDETVAADGRRLTTTLGHPAGGRPLVLIGPYDRAGGGCDAIRKVDGGLFRVAEIARQAHRQDCDVLAEGNALSFDVDVTNILIRSANARILVLETDLATCRRALTRRRKLGPLQAKRLDLALQEEKRRLDFGLRSLPACAPLHHASAAGAGPLVMTWLDAGHLVGRFGLPEQIPVIP